MLEYLTYDPDWIDIWDIAGDSMQKNCQWDSQSLRLGPMENGESGFTPTDFSPPSVES